jgi:hypothetical protein
VIAHGGGIGDVERVANMLSAKGPPATVLANAD